MLIVKLTEFSQLDYLTYQMNFVSWGEKPDPLQEHVKILCLVVLRKASYNSKKANLLNELRVYNKEVYIQA